MQIFVDTQITSRYIYFHLDVFAAMFSHRDTAEDKTNRVEITDVDEDSLEQLLKFIYTDKIDEANLTTLACGLLTAADKYNVQRQEHIFKH